MQPTDLTSAPAYSTRYKAWLLCLLLAIYASNFIDRIILASIGQPIREELQLTGTQFGLLGGIAFALFYSTLAIPIARLAEHRNRVGIITVATLTWSVMTALCGIAQNYWQLLLFRVGVGVGEAGLTPAAYSLISDHFPPNKRASAISVFNLGVPIGSLLGALASGWIAQHYGWRMAFILVGLPGVALALLAHATLRDPPRGYSDPARKVSSVPPPLMSVVRTLAAKKAFIHISIACCLTSFVNFGVNLFLPSYFSRTHGLSLAQAGLLFGLLTGVAGFVGILIGGFGTDRAARRDRRWVMWMPAMGLLFGAPLYIFATAQASVMIAFPLMMISSTFFYLWSPAANSSVQNMVEPRMRASAAAILSLLVNTVGTGCGPLLVGFLSDHYAQGMFALGSFASQCPGGIAAPGAEAAVTEACRSAAAGSIRLAIMSAAVVYVWAAIHFLLASRSLRTDLEAVAVPPATTAPSR